MESAALISKFHYFAANPQVAHAHGYDYSQPIKADGTAMNQSDYEAIANGAYGNRAELGNGPVAGGDGWRYRGGLKQLTGRANYRTFTSWHSENSSRWPGDSTDFEMNPDVLVQAKYAARSGAGFCKRNGLPSIADQGATVEVVDLITDVVNKGTDGRQARKDHLAKGRFQMRMLIQDLTWIALCVAGALGAGYAWADTMRRYVLRERIFILAVR